jgi:3-isopropylmalate dehydratase
MSPAMAAAAAIVGKLADVRKLASSHVASKSSPKVELDAHTEDIDSDGDLDRLLDDPQNSQGNVPASKAPSSSGMPKFTQLRGIAAALDISNIDTDAIIPKQFLKTIKRSGLGSALFHGWRYDPATGKENPSFILNQEPFRNSKILICTGPNFGCGSSREHAPWALLDFGITCIIAPSFGDIFYNNTFKNGMLPIRVAAGPELQAIAAEANAGREIEVDLPAQVIRAADGKELAKFDVEEFRKHCLINGLDDIGLTMQLEDKIRSFEGKRTREWPWLDGSGYLKKHRPGPVKVAAAPLPKTNRGEVLNEPLDW